MIKPSMNALFIFMQRKPWGSLTLPAHTAVLTQHRKAEAVGKIRSTFPRGFLG